MSKFAIEGTVKLIVDANKEPAVMNALSNLSTKGNSLGEKLLKVVQEKYNVNLSLEQAACNINVDEILEPEIDRTKLEDVLKRHEKIVEIWNEYISQGGDGYTVYRLNEDNFNKVFKNPYDVAMLATETDGFKWNDEYFIYSGFLESSKRATELMWIELMLDWVLAHPEIVRKYNIEIPYLTKQIKRNI